MRNPISLVVVLSYVAILFSCKDEELTASLATINTKPVTQITGTTAWSGGEVVNDGCSDSGTSVPNCFISANGIVWDTSPNPLIGLPTMTNNGPGSGSFDAQMTGLTVETTYYMRSYSTNSAGTAYGPEVTFVTVPVIGDEFQGGIVAYILEPGDAGYSATVRHGFICSKEDMPEYNWSVTNSNTGATATAIGSGQANTTTIIANLGVGSDYAARIADIFTAENGVITDWYLPSSEELFKMYENRAAIGNFGTRYYWSSTELDNASALRVDFFTGSIISNGKLNAHAVRPIRTF